MTEHCEVAGAATVRVLPERVLAAALALPDVKIDDTRWVEYEEETTRCCALGLVALAEGRVEIPAWSAWTQVTAAEVEENLGLDHFYRLGYDLGFGGDEATEEDFRWDTPHMAPELASVARATMASGNQDGLAARALLLDKIDDPSRYVNPTLWGFPEDD